MKIFRTGLMIMILLLTTAPLSATMDLDQKITLHLEEVPITTVLNMLARQYSLNIVQSSQLTEEISVNLDEVTLGDALNAILASNGYNHYFAGDIIVVKPLDINVPGELETLSISLKYISPESAVNVAEPLLTAKGRIKVLKAPAAGDATGAPRPDKIVISDLPSAVAAVAGLIEKVDLPRAQIAIEVKMIETNVDTEEKIGFNWPTSLGIRLHDAGDIATSADDLQALGQIQLPDGKWSWGKLSVEETRLVLDFLDQAGHSKLLSDPRITTLDNHEAEIKVTTIVPIQTINRFSEGGSVQDIVTFQDEEVGITLKVTPHVIGDGEMILDVNPTVAEIIGYSGSIDNQKPITSERSVRTRIKVNDGETAVLGGLLKENKIETEQRLFFLGSLPILGNLFRHKNAEVKTTDLLILISPKIVKY